MNGPPPRRSQVLWSSAARSSASPGRGPSLGEMNTTLSYPETTSHRGMTIEQRAALGITGGTIRLSVGTESIDFIRDALTEGLRSLDG